DFFHLVNILHIITATANKPMAIITKAGQIGGSFIGGGV
ncbi:hypothetical protein LCGC14_2839570, partial [marine sediment metagenome]